MGQGVGQPLSRRGDSICATDAREDWKGRPLVLKVAIASGKGGTGKTTVATNLAWLAGRRGHDVAYLDCDVEEPNGHIFLKPAITRREVFRLPVPRVDEARCDGCGRCGQFCRFNAIAVLGGRVLLYPELCHACGGCALICPQGAIREEPRRVGVVETGTAGPVRFVHGRLDVGQAMSPPLIRAVKAAAPDEAELIIRDCPPGASCPVIECVRGCDLVVLVTEPTLSGQHDLERVSQLTAHFGIKTVVCINKYDLNPGMAAQMERRAAEMGLRVVGKVSYDPAVTKAQIMRASVVEYTGGKVAEEIKALWRQVVYELG